MASVLPWINFSVMFANELVNQRKFPVASPAQAAGIHLSASCCSAGIHTNCAGSWHHLAATPGGICTYISKPGEDCYASAGLRHMPTSPALSCPFLHLPQPTLHWPLYVELLIPGLGWLCSQLASPLANALTLRTLLPVEVRIWVVLMGVPNTANLPSPGEAHSGERLL